MMIDTLTKAFAAVTLFLSLSFASTAQEENSFVHEQSDGYVYPTDPEVLSQLSKWQDQKFGVLIHWGLYAIPGIVESWNLCNEDWIVRPEGSTYEGYKQWYWGLSKEFNPVDFNPDQWADVLSRTGMKYVIFTTKHHDGFCMFDSRLTDFTVAKGPFADDPRKDIANEVFKAFRKKDFMIGAYFSKPDWHCEWFWNPYYATPDRMWNYKIDQHPDWWKKYQDFTAGQLDELTGGRYGRIDILWLDGGWITGDQVGLDGILEKARKVSPGLISVDRTIEGKNENYQTPERMVPDHQINHPWESCLPLSNDWGWVPNAPYKSAGKVINTLAEITAKGGCLVLGVGPTAKGVIEEREVDILLQIGDWLDRYGEAIYSTRAVPQYNCGKIWFNGSKDGKTLYAIYALEDGESLPGEISWEGNLPEGKVILLDGGKTLRTKVEGGKVTVTLPKGMKSESFALKFQVK